MVVTSQNQSFFVQKWRTKSFSGCYRLSNATLSFNKMQIIDIRSRVELQFGINRSPSIVVNAIKDVLFKELKKKLISALPSSEALP